MFNEKPTQEDLEGHQQQQVAKLGNVAKVTTVPWHIPVVRATHIYLLGVGVY